MQIWLDTIDETAIADAAKTGVISGVTTNPSILAGSKNVFETISKLLDLQPGPVVVQVTATDPEGMIEEGLRIFDFSPRMIVKVPINRNGLIAIQHLHRQNVPILGTGILFPSQALLASNQGVSLIAPYFGHMGTEEEAATTLKTIVDLLRISASPTKILVASLRQVDHIIACALLGVAAVTIKPALYDALMADHPVVEGFSERFLSDWTKTHGQRSIKDALKKREPREQPCLLQ